MVVTLLDSVAMMSGTGWLIGVTVLRHCYHGAWAYDLTVSRCMTQ